MHLLLVSGIAHSGSVICSDSVQSVSNASNCHAQSCLLFRGSELALLIAQLAKLSYSQRDGHQLRIFFGILRGRHSFDVVEVIEILSTKPDACGELLKKISDFPWNFPTRLLSRQGGSSLLISFCQIPVQYIFWQPKSRVFRSVFSSLITVLWGTSLMVTKKLGVSCQADCCCNVS